MVVYTIYSHQAQKATLGLFSYPQKYSSTREGLSLTNSVFGLQIWLMRHEFNQNESVRRFSGINSSCRITITGVLPGEGQCEPMMQTKQLKEVRFLVQIILNGDISLTKQAVSRREYLGNNIPL
jgi:hypothetical protein